VVVFLALMQVPDTPDLPDDPGLARLLRRGPAIEEEAEPPAPFEPEHWPLFRFGMAFGYASPLVDPDVNEGYGGGLDVALGRRLTLELRSSAAYNRYVDPLDNMGVQFISGDITLGPGYAFFVRPRLRMAFFGGVGPAWMSTWLGITWSIGVMGGMGLEWEVNRWFGLRVEARYHLFHLTEIGGEKFYDRRALRTIGPVDRLDIPVGLVFRL